MIIRYATTADIKSFYEAKGEPDLGYTYRAVVAEHEGRIIGIGGIYYQMDKTMVCFSDMLDEMKQYKKAIVRVSYMVMQMVIERGIPVMALCQDEKSLNFCKAFGFKQYLDTERGWVLKWLPPYHTY
jgi:hypothetical protein